MFYMHVYYTAKDEETLKKFVAEVRNAGTIEKTRAEEGNLLYEYYYSEERPNEILILEKWKSEEDQKTHDTLPHLVELMKIKTEYGIETKVTGIYCEEEF